MLCLRQGISTLPKHFNYSRKNITVYNKQASSSAEHKARNYNGKNILYDYSCAIETK